MRIGVTGKNSLIAREFVRLASDCEFVYGTVDTLPTDLDGYFLCAGVLIGKDARSITDEEAKDTLWVNFLDVVRFCDRVFESNNRARVCIMGSMSGVQGSFDTVYAASKSGLHMYVETKKLTHSEQHIVAIAPTIIEDTGMTRRRKDFDQVIARGAERRLGRWLRSEEVARTALFALNERALSNTVIRITGGNW